MLKVYQQQNGGLKGTVLSDATRFRQTRSGSTCSTRRTRSGFRVNALLGVEMPTRADMEEIEISSRLYQENGGIFLTALILSNAESETRPPPMW